MAIKLKNSRKFGAVLILVILFLCSFGMVAAYPVFAGVMEPTPQGQVSADYMLDIMDNMIRGGYYLYNEAEGGINQSQVMTEYGEDEFFLMSKYMDFDVFSSDENEAEEGLLGRGSSDTVRRLLRENTDYGLRAVFEYDPAGQIHVEVDGVCLDEDERYQMEQSVYHSEYLKEEIAHIFATPCSNVI